MIIDESMVLGLNIGGRGGKEASLLALFPDYERVSAPLYDFVNAKDSKDRIETKKQANCQWFDIGKYHNLSDDEKKYPSMQVKVKLNVKSFHKKYEKQLETLYISS